VQENIHQTMAAPFHAPLESSVALKVLDYVHPREVVQDDRLGPADKRAILSAWASDACAVESRPGFRWLGGTPGPILVDHVLAALQTLDDMAGLHNHQHHAPVRGPEQPRHGHLFARAAKRGATVGGIGH
jgi:hypothetical protein